MKMNNNFDADTVGSPSKSPRKRGKNTMMMV